MRHSKVSIDEIIRYYEKENATLKQEQERLKGAIKDLMDENFELIEKIDFLRDEIKTLKYESHLTSIISSLGTVKFQSKI